MSNLVFTKCLNKIQQIFIKPLKVQQNKIVRICLKKHSLAGFIQQNYRELKMFSVNLVRKKFAILWLIKIFIISIL